MSSTLEASHEFRSYRLVLYVLGLGWPCGAYAQLAEGSGNAALTGSPSNGNATVSAVTVAGATGRADARDNFGLSLGTSVLNGKFGGARASEIVSTALAIRYTRGPIRLSASMPYMRVRTAGLIYSGIDSTPVAVSTTGPRRRSTYDGLGDLTLGASYTFLAPASRLEVEVSGRVKVPTATRSSGLSSQKTDVATGVQVTRQAGRFGPFVSVTYRMFGDPRPIDLRDGFAASAGSSLVISDNLVALASYHYARGASRLVNDAHELFAGASYLVPGSSLRLTGFGTAGLSRGAARLSGGISAAVDFR